MRKLRILPCLDSDELAAARRQELGLPREEMPSQLRRNTLRFMLTGSTFPVKGNLESILNAGARRPCFLARDLDTQLDLFRIVRHDFGSDAILQR